jgi:hypothetical protein
MKRYDPPKLRPAFALGAAALTVGAMALAVYLPAKSALSSAGVSGADRVEVAIEPARIDVVGVRRATTRAHVNEASAPAV